MSSEYVWLVAVGTFLSLGLVVVAVYFLRGYRRQLLPPGERKDRGEALAELHRLKAEMRKKLAEGEDLAQAPGLLRAHPDPSQAATSHPRKTAPQERMTPPQERMTPPQAETQGRRTESPAKPRDDKFQAEAVAQLQALQAKMRKKLEEDQARERALGLDTGSPDPGIDDDDFEL